MPSARLLRSLVLLALPLVLGAGRLRAPSTEGAGSQASSRLSVTSGAARLGAAGSARVAGHRSAVPEGLLARAVPARPTASVAQALSASLTRPDAIARASLVPLGTLAVISAPRQSLPPPVHDEATCAFCQAAIFPPCAPQPVAVSLELLGLVRQARAPADAAAPQFTTHHRTSSRAPPPLRSI
jgi:hypothetical protein